MNDEYLETLEANLYAAVHTLEGERYYQFSAGMVELVRQAKHYQRIAESLLASQTGLPLELNHAEFNRASSERDWFRFPEYERPQRPCGEIES